MASSLIAWCFLVEIAQGTGTDCRPVRGLIHRQLAKFATEVARLLRPKAAERAMPATVRYEPPERPPHPLAAGLGLQQAVLSVASVVLTPVIVIRAAGATDPYLSWAVFAALLVSGATTIVQAKRMWRLGAGYPLLMGTSGAFIAVCVVALADGGPALLATLVFASALFQFLLAGKLVWLRRIVTPTVAGTVVMLIAVTVMPVVFDMLPSEGRALGAPASAAVALAVTAGLAMRATGALRLWVPLIGLAVGCAVASFFGLYDTARVAEAAWLGLPHSGWPGLDLHFGPTFWALLPAFVFATLIGAIETVGDASAMQAVAWRRPRSTDYREVQGAVAADGLGNLLSGLAATVPNTTYSKSVSIAELTGVAARRVGVWIGAVFVAMAFVPKAAALLLAVPGSVAAAYMTVFLAMLFVLGMKMVVQDGLDYRKGVIVGVSFWIGVGFQHQEIFAHQLGGWWGTLLGNGMTSGGLTAIALSAVMELAGGRRRRLESTLDAGALPAVDAFLGDLGRRAGWSEGARQRLRAAGEEALECLLRASSELGEARRLRLVARADRASASLELVAAVGQDNIEDLLVRLTDLPGNAPEREVSLRLLRHHADTVRHQQYHGTDVLAVTVAAQAPEMGGQSGPPPR